MSAQEATKYTLADIRPPFYPCPISEQETIIQISRDGDTAQIYTNDLKMLTRLKKAMKSQGSEWRLIEISHNRGRQSGWGFECPKRLLSFRSKKMGAAEKNPSESENSEIDAEGE